MDLKTRIRVALGIEEETTQLAYEGKLADGTIIVSEADALAEGVAVNVLVEDGTQIPLPVGEYELEDGTKFVVEEEGVIASMETEAEEEEDDMGKKKEEEYEEELTEEYYWFAGLNDARQDAMIDLSFNLGQTRLRGFVKALEAMSREQFDIAADEFMDSKWAKQVGMRAIRVTEMIRSGEYI